MNNVPCDISLRHISDLANIPDEHLEEFLLSMPSMIAMLKVAKNECAHTGAVLAEIMPVVRFVPDATTTFTLRHGATSDTYRADDVIAAAKRI